MRRKQTDETDTLVWRCECVGSRYRVVSFGGDHSDGGVAAFLDGLPAREAARIDVQLKRFSEIGMVENREVCTQLHACGVYEFNGRRTWVVGAVDQRVLILTHGGRTDSGEVKPTLREILLRRQLYRTEQREDE